MNVIIGNKQQNILDNLGIDVIKSINGEFDVDTIIETFKNFFYQRMILDITAIKDYKDIKNLQKLTIALETEKLILLLDNTSESEGDDYISKIISMGIYNFTKNAEGILYLYQTPNNYRDVAQYHQLDTPEPVVHNISHVNSSTQCRVIGVKSLTDGAGATTLIYMMLKAMQKNNDVIAVEVNGSDSKFFNESNFLSLPAVQVSNFILKNNDKNVIFVDVNNEQSVLGLITEMIYLVEPSTVKLNKLLYTNRSAFKITGNQKLVLNKSLLSPKEVNELELEVKTNFVGNIPPLDERSKNYDVINNFLNNLGFYNQGN